MTVPVSTRVSTVDQEDARVTREEMGFYVPEEHQAAPPPPTGEVRAGDITVMVMMHHHLWCKHCKR